MQTDNFNNKHGKRKLTQEQKDFCICKKILETLDQKEVTEGLTNEDKRTRDLVNTELWSKVVKYARSLAKQSLASYTKSIDYMDDVLQSMAMYFYTNLPNYDPTQSTPTTFFTPYFYEAITTYKRKESQHMTTNDAHNIGKVKKAINDHNSRNEGYTAQILAMDTGLSLKVVKNTIQRMQNSGMANIDDLINMKSDNLTPEEHFLEQEKKELLYNAVDSELSEDEKEFLYAKLNYSNGEKELTYTALAKMFKMEISAVKAKWNSIITKLSNNPDIKHFRPSIKEDVTYSMMSDATDTMEEDLLSGIEELNSSDDN